MEQNEKIQKPRWVTVLEKDYKPIVHQLVGQLCGNMIQTCMNLYGLNSELYFACLEQVDVLIKEAVEADAKALADELVNEASK